MHYNVNLTIDKIPKLSIVLLYHSIILQLQNNHYVILLFVFWRSKINFNILFLFNMKIVVSVSYSFTEDRNTSDDL